MKTVKQIIADNKGFIIVMVWGVAGFALSFWWQVHQGSVDFGWNMGMGMMGFISGVFGAMTARG